MEIAGIWGGWGHIGGSQGRGVWGESPPGGVPGGGPKSIDLFPLENGQKTCFLTKRLGFCVSSKAFNRAVSSKIQ